MAYENAPNVTASADILLGSRIEILPSQPLPDLNSEGGMAFAARFKTDAASDLYALIRFGAAAP